MEFHRPPNFPWILAAIPGSQNHHTGYSVLSWFLYLVFGFCWLGFIWLPWSIINQLRHWHWRDVTVKCIFPFSNLNFTYWRWSRWGWRRWWRMTLLFRTCLWSRWRSRRWTWQAWNHERNEVFRIANYPNPFLMRCGFWPLIHSWEYPFSSQSFPSDNTAGVFLRTFIVKNISNSLTYTVVWSSVCTSPLAVMTVAGLHDFVKVSISALLKSFLLIMCIEAPESTTNFFVPQV